MSEMYEMISVPVILDVFLIGLLGVTITFCVRLNKKLSVMRDAQTELHKVAVEFDQAIVRSRLGIEELKNTTRDVRHQIEGELEKAKPIIDELKLMNASSSRIADRLQENVTHSSDNISMHAQNVTDLTGQQSNDEIDNLEPRTEAERELLEMLTKSR